MKNYKEMADSVFQRSHELLAKKAKRRKTTNRILYHMSFFCLVALLGFGIWKSDLLDQTPIALTGYNSGSEGNVTPIGNTESSTNHSDDNSASVTPNQSNLSESQGNTTPDPNVGSELQNTASSGDHNAHAVYLTISATYEKAKRLFGHSIIECSSPGLLGYELGVITPSGNINDSKTSYLSVIYSFQDGKIELIDQSRLGAGASISYEFYPTEEYGDCIFWHDSTSGNVYLPLSDNLLMIANFGHMELSEVYDLLLVLGGKV